MASFLTPQHEADELRKRGYDPFIHEVGDDGSIRFKSQGFEQPAALSETSPLMQSKGALDDKLPTTSAAEAAWTSAKGNLIPAAAGIAGGVGGGALLGALAGGTAGSVVPVVGNVVGALLGGVGGALAGDWLQQKYLLSDEFKQELATAQQEHPVASTAGALAPNLLAFKPSFRNVGDALRVLAGNEGRAVSGAQIGNLANVALGGGVGAGFGIADEMREGDPEGVDWSRLALLTGGGALINQPYKYMGRVGIHPYEPASRDGTLTQGGGIKAPPDKQLASRFERRLAELQKGVNWPETAEAKASKQLIKENEAAEMAKLKEEEIDAIRRSPESPLSQATAEAGAQLEAKNVTPRVTENAWQWFQSLAKDRGVKLEAGEAGGSAGAYTPAERLAEVNLTKAKLDTAPHEVQHAMSMDLENSPHYRDQKMWKRYEAAIQETPEFKAWQELPRIKDNPKLDTISKLIHEFTSEEGGIEAVVRGMNLNNEGALGKWYKDARAYWLSKWDRAGAAEWRRLLGNRLLNDPTYAERFAGVAARVSGAGEGDVRESKESQLGLGEGKIPHPWNWDKVIRGRLADTIMRNKAKAIEVDAKSDIERMIPKKTIERIETEVNDLNNNFVSDFEVFLDAESEFNSILGIKSPRESNDVAKILDSIYSGKASALDYLLSGEQDDLLRTVFGKRFQQLKDKATSIDSQLFDHSEILGNLVNDRQYRAVDRIEQFRTDQPILNQPESQLGGKKIPPGELKRASDLLDEVETLREELEIPRFKPGVGDEAKQAQFMREWRRDAEIFAIQNKLDKKLSNDDLAKAIQAELDKQENEFLEAFVQKHGFGSTDEAMDAINNLAKSITKVEPKPATTVPVKAEAKPAAAPKAAASKEELPGAKSTTIKPGQELSAKQQQEITEAHAGKAPAPFKEPPPLEAIPEDVQAARLEQTRKEWAEIENPHVDVEKAYNRLIADYERNAKSRDQQIGVSEREKGRIRNRAQMLEMQYNALRDKHYKTFVKKGWPRSLAEGTDIRFSEESQLRGGESTKEDIELGFNKAQIMHLLGPTLYSKPIGEVAVKELFQNSFDALKEAIYKGKLREGQIDINVDHESRTITVKDNGVGMTPEIVKKAYFEIGGSQKDLPPELRSGGLGIAKMGFMLGSDSIKVSTVRDGVKTTVDVTSEQIRNSKFPIESVKTGEPNGTTVEVKIPSHYVDSNGEQRGIHMPWNQESIPSLRNGFINDNIKVNYNGEPVVPEIPPKFTTAKFDWGTADIYVSDQPRKYPDHSVYSSGIYQFDIGINKPGTWDRVPFDVKIDIKPKVGTGDTYYPFNNQREGFRSSINEDIEALQNYIGRIGHLHDENVAKAAFKNIKSLPKIDVTGELSVADRARLGETVRRTGESGRLRKATRDDYEYVIIHRDTGEVKSPAGDILSSTRDKKFRPASFKADKDIKLREAVDISEFNPANPQFHNNTTGDFTNVEGAPEFFARIGSIMLNLKDWAAKNLGYSYRILNQPEIKYFAGVSVDKEYGGVHTNYPFKGIFLNPAAVPHEISSAQGLAGYYAHVAVHELAHTIAKEEGAGFTSELAQLYAKLEDLGYYDELRTLFRSVTERHLPTINEIRHIYDSSRTTNIAKSLKEQQEGQGLSTRSLPRDESNVSTGQLRQGIEESSRPNNLDVETKSADISNRAQDEFGDVLASKNRQAQLGEESPTTVDQPASYLRGGESGYYGKKSTLPGFRSEIDKVRLMGEQGAVAAAGLTGFYEKFNLFYGELVNDIARKLIKHVNRLNPKEYLTLNNEKFNNVVKYLDDMSDFGRSDIALSVEEQQIAQEVRDNLLKSFEMRNARPDLHDPADPNPNYFPHVVNRDVLKTILNKPHTPEAARYRQDWLDYYTQQLGKTEEEAKKDLGIMLGSYNKQKTNLAEQFGPIDENAGLGIPQSWREKNLMDRMARFNRRYSRRLAYFDAIESQPKVVDALDPQKGGVGSSDAAKNVLDDINGRREIDEAKRTAISGIVRAAMMGTLTGAKDFTSNLVLGFQHQSPTQALRSPIEAWKNFKSNLEDTFRLGLNRQNIGSFEFGDGGVSDMLRLSTRVRDIINEVQGRNWFEQMTRATAFGQAKWLVMDNMAMARKGSLGKQGKKFLDDFAPGWEEYASIGELPTDMMELAASRYVGSVQGHYDYRGLPAIAMKGSLAPYLSLARWNVEKVNNFTKYAIHPLVKEGNPYPFLMATVGMIIGGEAVNQVSELMTGRKERTPKYREIAAAIEAGQDVTPEIIYKGTALAALAGYGGMLGDLARSAMDITEKNVPQTYNNPLISGLATGGDMIVDAVEAFQNGDFDFGMEAINRFFEDYFQGYRIALAQIGSQKKEDLSRSNKFRDLKVYKQLYGEKLPPAFRGRANPFVDKEAREFKRTSDPAEAARMLPGLVRRALEKAEGSPEKLRAELTKLKLNSYQTMPNPETMPSSFVKYIQFLERTEGKEEATARLVDYLRQNELNKLKSSVIPDFKFEGLSLR